MALLVTLSVKDNQPTPQPVNGVVIHVYDSANTLLATGQTGQGADPAGVLTLSLSGSVSPGTQYIVRQRKPNVTFSLGATQSIFVIEPLVPATPNIFDFTAVVATTPNSDDPDMCRLTGYLADASMRPLRRARMRLVAVTGFPDEGQSVGGLHYLGDPAVLRNRVLVSADFAIQANDTGYVDFLLPRLGVYDLQLLGAEHPMIVSQRIYVPDALGWAFEDVLFPFVKQLNYGAASLALTVGGSKDLGISAVISDGRTLTTFERLGKVLTFSLQDATIASVAFGKDAVVTLSGLKVGSTTLKVARPTGSVAPRRPAVAAITVTNPTITVS